MDLESAIKSALEYENRVHDLYHDAAIKAQDEAARKVFETLANEERGHIYYLQSRLEEWQKTGHLTPEKLETTLPSKDEIEKGMLELKKRIQPREGNWDVEMEMLQKALAVETETSAFYASMVEQLTDEGQELFRRFMEIEEGHKAIVQAEIDSVSGLGFWFDCQEFTLEG
jgi:rubrerythrin